MNCHCNYDRQVPLSLLKKTEQKIYLAIDKEKRLKKLRNISLLALGFIILLMVIVLVSARAETIDVQKLATAIYYTENSKTHPYGILAHYKTTTPRQACINTINSALKRFNKQSKEKDFIYFLSLTYAPINCDNDNGTNRFWVKNVKYWLSKNEK